MWSAFWRPIVSHASCNRDLPFFTPAAGFSVLVRKREGVDGFFRVTALQRVCLRRMLVFYENNHERRKGGEGRFTFSVKKRLFFSFWVGKNKFNQFRAARKNPLEGPWKNPSGAHDNNSKPRIPFIQLKNTSSCRQTVFSFLINKRWMIGTNTLCHYILIWIKRTPQCQLQRMQDSNQIFGNQHNKKVNTRYRRHDNTRTIRTSNTTTVTRNWVFRTEKCNMPLTKQRELCG